ncbi:hypothetical protein Saso_53290 [Streptomyces asoensis]|uniref:Uncharacterized protein n=1 Tax=Streptomyces asoensis TaxID=249586 RepID=A0ABQ3S6F2_9ACTN|nr:hypothetical protein Saso_53290 [Streptomyces asoensis]
MVAHGAKGRKQIGEEGRRPRAPGPVGPAVRDNPAGVMFRWSVRSTSVTLAHRRDGGVTGRHRPHRGPSAPPAPGPRPGFLVPACDRASVEM